MCRTPAASAARAISTASVSVIASGFSQSTCMPAATAAIVMGWCDEFGVATMTASTPDSRMSANGSVHVAVMPLARAASASTAGFVSQSAVTAASGHRDTPGR